MHMVYMSRTTQLVWNVQILNSEGRSGTEAEVEAGDMSVDEIIEGETVARKGKKWYGE